MKRAIQRRDPTDANESHLNCGSFFHSANFDVAFVALGRYMQCYRLTVNVIKFELMESESD